MYLCRPLSWRCHYFCHICGHRPTPSEQASKLGGGWIEDIIYFLVPNGNALSFGATTIVRERFSYAHNVMPIHKHVTFLLSVLINPNTSATLSTEMTSDRINLLPLVSYVNFLPKHFNIPPGDSRRDLDNALASQSKCMKFYGKYTLKVKSVECSLFSSCSPHRSLQVRRICGECAIVWNKKPKMHSSPLICICDRCLYQTISVFVCFNF